MPELSIQERDGLLVKAVRKFSSMPKLSIISATVDSPEWAELLVKAVRKFSSLKYELIIIDNGSLPENLTWLESQEDVDLVKLPRNIGHGDAMDLGTRLAKAEYICFLDIDSHPMRRRWDRELIDLYNADPETRLVGCIGPDHKPLHPPLFFYKKAFIVENNILFKYQPRISTDTAQKSYWDILALGFKVHRLEKGPKVYNCIGDEIQLNGQSSLYHHWYGTRFCEHNPEKRKDRLDGYSLEEHLENKRQLLEHPLVMEILDAKEWK